MSIANCVGTRWVQVGTAVIFSFEVCSRRYRYTTSRCAFGVRDNSRPSLVIAYELERLQAPDRGRMRTIRGLDRMIQIYIPGLCWHPPIHPPYTLSIGLHPLRDHCTNLPISLVALLDFILYSILCHGKDFLRDFVRSFLFCNFCGSLPFLFGSRLQ